MTITKEQIAKDLLSIRAVFLKPDDPFTWASGIHSPIYCDNRHDFVRSCGTERCGGRTG